MPSSPNSAPHFERERQLGCLTAGIDEAGRGPLAGPVVASAVVFLHERDVPPGVNDSKTLPRARRSELARQIWNAAYVGIGVAEVEEIDRLNILHASMLAMRRAFADLPVAAQAALVDGNRAPSLPVAAQPVVGGDGICLSIAAASIVAKVARDAYMESLSAHHPHYRWCRNAGYGTREHLEALETHGPTPHHRQSFHPVRQLSLPAL